MRRWATAARSFRRRRTDHLGAIADWTAITGIAVSGVVGPGIAATLALWLQGRIQRHDREMADLGELRWLLSQASADLRDAEGLRAAAGSAIMNHGESVHARAPDVVKMIQEGGRKVTLQSERIGLLVGEDHAVAAAHREVVDLITEALTTLLRAEFAADEDARKEWLALLDNEPMKVARVRFVSEAHRLVGSRVRPS
jgi:hypothetical protein